MKEGIRGAKRGEEKRRESREVSGEERERGDSKPLSYRFVAIYILQCMCVICNCALRKLEGNGVG